MNFTAQDEQDMQDHNEAALYVSYQAVIAACDIIKHLHADGASRVELAPHQAHKELMVDLDLWANWHHTSGQYVPVGLTALPVGIEVLFARMEDENEMFEGEFDF